MSPTQDNGRNSTNRIKSIFKLKSWKDTYTPPLHDCCSLRDNIMGIEIALKFREPWFCCVSVIRIIIAHIRVTVLHWFRTASVWVYRQGISWIYLFVTVCKLTTFVRFKRKICVSGLTMVSAILRTSSCSSPDQFFLKYLILHFGWRTGSNFIS